MQVLSQGPWWWTVRWQPGTPQRFKKLLGGPPGQGNRLGEGQQVTQNLPIFAAVPEVVYPAEVASLTDSDIASNAPATDTTSPMAVPLKEDWVAALEKHIQRRFTKFYNCNVNGKSVISEMINPDGPFALESEEHALYFLPALTAKKILRIMQSSHSAKLQHGRSSACFILPKRKAEWNSRVVHVQNLGSRIDTAKLDIVDCEAVAKKTDIASSNQSVHNVVWMHRLYNDRMNWEVQHDPPSAIGD